MTPVDELRAAADRIAHQAITPDAAPYLADLLRKLANPNQNQHAQFYAAVAFARAVNGTTEVTA